MKIQGFFGDLTNIFGDFLHTYTHMHSHTVKCRNYKIQRALLIYPSRKKKGKNIHKVRDFICIFKTVKEEDSTFKDCSQKMKEKSY